MVLAVLAVLAALAVLAVLAGGVQMALGPGGVWYWPCWLGMRGSSCPHVQAVRGCTSRHIKWLR